MPNKAIWPWAKRQRQPAGPAGLVLRQEDAARLAALGIHPERLADRLRLVLVMGCYRDFRFTRDILNTGAAHEQTEMAIQALEKLGATCDCGVLRAIRQPPRGVLWHHPTPPIA